jgi:predicted dehydrogenase
MVKPLSITRRDLLRGAIAAAAAPYVVSATVLGAGDRPAPSNRICVGNIGVGGRGNSHIGSLLEEKDAQILSVCDVDKTHRDKTTDRVEQRYGRDRAGGYAGCKSYADFREVLARPDIDAIVIGTPDHWHALISVMAAKAGKDIYCEKPMNAVIADGRAAADAVKRYGRVFQTGSQERSGGARFACELVRNGYLGKIHTIRTFLPTGDKHSGATGPMPVPEGFDYDTWLGPAPWEPYHPARCHGNFRWVMDYSDGELTDRGAHVNDIALWGAGPLLVGPVEIEGRGTFIRDPLWNVPYAYHIEFTYANGLKFIVDSSDAPGGVICSITGAHRGILFEGTEGKVFVAIHGAALAADPPSLLRTVLAPGDITLPRTRGHMRNWLDCIKTREAPVAPAEDGHRTASFCHLTLIACLLGRKLRWDLEKEQFIGDRDANAFVTRPMRPPWHL